PGDQRQRGSERLGPAWRAGRGGRHHRWPAGLRDSRKQPAGAVRPRRAQRERLLAPRGHPLQRRRPAGGEPDPRLSHQLVHGARHLPSPFDHDHHAARDDHHHSADDVHHLHEQYDDDPAPHHDHDVYDLHDDRAPGDNLHDDAAPDHDHDVYELRDDRAPGDNLHDDAGSDYHHDVPGLRYDRAPRNNLHGAAPVDDHHHPARHRHGHNLLP